MNPTFHQSTSRLPLKGARRYAANHHTAAGPCLHHDWRSIRTLPRVSANAECEPKITVLINNKNVKYFMRFSHFEGCEKDLDRE
jgi:hypothetical protein